MFVFAALIAAILLTIGLLDWVTRRLRKKHTDFYASSGIASIMKSKSMSNIWIFIRFLYGSSWQGLDDRALVRAIRVLQVLFLISMGLLVASFIVR